MIGKIGLENFKAFGPEQTLPIKPLTLIYGANSSGKSSIFQALLMLKQTMSGQDDGFDRLIANGKYVNLGSFTNIIHNHNVKSKLAVLFESSDPIKQFELKELGVDVYSRFKLSYSLSSDGSAYLENIYFGFSCDSDYVITYEYFDKNYFRIKQINSSKVFDQDIEELTKIYSNFKYNESEQKLNLKEILIKNYHNELHYALECSDYKISFRKNGSENFPSLKMTLSKKHLINGRNIFNYISKKSGEDFTNIFPRESDGYYDYTELIAYYSKTAKFKKEFLDRNSNLYANVYKFGQNVSSVKDLRVDSKKIFGLKLNEIVFKEIKNMFESLHGGINYTAPIRSFPERYYASDKVENISSHDNFIGKNVPEILYETKDLLGNVNNWFKKLDIPYTLDISCHSVSDELKIYLTKIENQQGISVTPVDVGFGISQILPIIINSLSCMQMTLLMEQPEIHLHPKLQTELGDLLIYSAKNNGNTVLVETHSEHLLLRILRRIRETTAGTLKDSGLALTPKDVSILYIEAADRGSIVYELRVDDQGEFIDKWPQGFFDERLAEIF